jgi:hypothetical protein
MNYNNMEIVKEKLRKTENKDKQANLKRKVNNKKR